MTRIVVTADVFQLGPNHKCGCSARSTAGSYDERASSDGYCNV